MVSLKDSKPVTVRLPADLNSRLETVADQEHRTTSSLIRHILATALDSRAANRQTAGERA